MSWLGKVLGGTFGFLFGGPLGMVAGIAFGNLFDKADDFQARWDEREDAGARWWQQQENYYRERQQYPEQRREETFRTFEERDIPFEKLQITQKQLMYFTGTFSMIYCVANADGTITKNEIVAIERDIITERLQFTPREGQVAMKFFYAAKENNSTIDAYARQFESVFSSSPALLQLMVDFLYQVRAVDGDATGSKDRMIMQVAAIFKIPSSILIAIRRKNDKDASEIDRLFASLHLPSTATSDETKHAWRKACAEFHPDTLESQGLGTEFKKVAETQFAEINASYDRIKQIRGWK